MKLLITTSFSTTEIDVNDENKQEIWEIKFWQKGRGIKLPSRVLH